MIMIKINRTGKGYGRNAEWQHLTERPEEVFVADLAAARKYLREKYGKCSRQAMYNDYKDGTKRIGWVFGFRNEDWSHSQVQKWLQQDWVSLYECSAVDLDAAK
jgi:hypothetical protein